MYIELDEKVKKYSSNKNYASKYQDDKNSVIKGMKKEKQKKIKGRKKNKAQ